MPSSTAPYSIIGRVESALSCRLLTEHGCSPPKDWNELGPRKRVTALKDILDKCTADVSESVLFALSQVPLFDCEDGPLWLLQAAAHRDNAKLVEALKQTDASLDRALLAFLEDEEAFRVAIEIAEAERLRGKQGWREREIESLAQGHVNESNAQALAKSIGEFFKERDGRGRFNIPEVVKVGEQRIYFFLTLSGWANKIRMFTASGGLKDPIGMVPFEILFVLDFERKSLATWARGGKEVLDGIDALFSQQILSEPLPPIEASPPLYALDRFIEEDFSFDVKPEDGVDEFVLRQLGWAISNSEGRSIVFVGNHKDSPRDVWLMRNEYLNPDKHPSDCMRPKFAVLGIRFTKPYFKQQQTATLRIGGPFSSTINELPPSVQPTVLGILKRSKVYLGG